MEYFHNLNLFFFLLTSGVENISVCPLNSYLIKYSPICY